MDTTGLAPGSAPGGTQQRPSNEPTARRPPERPFYQVARVPTPAARRDNYYPINSPVFARKDDYYPRLAPNPIPVRREEPPRTAPAPPRRDIFSRPPAPAPPPTRDIYSRPTPAPARDIYSRPPPAPARDIFSRPPPARNDHARPFWGQSQPRPRQEVAPSHQNAPQAFRGQAPEPARSQPQPQQGLRDQAKTPSKLQPTAPVGPTQNDEKPTRASQIPQEEKAAGTVRRDFDDSSQDEEIPPVPPTEADRARSRQASAAISRRPTRQATDPATKPEQGGGRRPSQVATSPSQPPQEQAPATRRRSSTREGNSRAEPTQAEKVSEESDGYTTPRPEPQDQGNGSSGQGIADRDGTTSESERPSFEFPRPPSHSIGVSRTRTGATAIPRSLSAEEQARRLSTVHLPLEGSPATAQIASRTETWRDKSGDVTGTSRASARRESATRASNAEDNREDSRASSTATSWRPSTAIERTRTAQRLSARGTSPGRFIPSRTATASTTAPTLSSQPRSTDRRASTTKASSEQAFSEGQSTPRAAEQGFGPRKASARPRTGSSERANDAGLGARETPQRTPTIYRPTEALRRASTVSRLGTVASIPRTRTLEDSTPGTHRHFSAVPRLAESKSASPPRYIPTTVSSAARQDSFVPPATSSGPGAGATRGRDDTESASPSEPTPAKRQTSWKWLGRGGKAGGGEGRDGVGFSNQRAEPPNAKETGVKRDGSPTTNGNDRDGGANEGKGTTAGTGAEQPGAADRSGKVKAAVVQGNSGLRGRWGWGWGRN